MSANGDNKGLRMATKYVTDEWYVRAWVVEKLDSVIVEICDYLLDNDISYKNPTVGADGADLLDIYSAMERFIEIGDLTDEEMEHALRHIELLCYFKEAVRHGYLTEPEPGVFRITSKGEKFLNED